MPPPTDALPFVAVGAAGQRGLADIQNLPAALQATFTGTVLVVLIRPWKDTTVAEHGGRNFVGVVLSGALVAAMRARPEPAQS